MPTIELLFGGVEFDRGRVFQTDDLEEAKALASRIFSPHDLSVIGQGQRLSAVMDHLVLSSMSLNHMGWGASVRVTPTRPGDYYLLSMPLQGHGKFSLNGRTTIVSNRCPFIFSASQECRIETAEGFEQVVLRIGKRAVEEGLQALTGREPPRSINFDGAMAVTGTGWRALEPLMHWVAKRAREPLQSGLSSAHFDARLEEMLVHTLLINAAHDQSASIWPTNGAAGPRHLRRAEEFMLQHLDSALTTGLVARECGVSIRTLQAAFHAKYGQGPMQWLRERRLHAVREVLIASSGRAVIGTVAMRFGFTHMGDFSQAYRRCFGETARQTLRSCDSV